MFTQELGIVLKSEQREALESLLRGKDVFVSCQQALAIFNCNDDPYSVAVFSFSLIGKSIVAQIVDKDSRSLRATKNSFFRRSTNFKNVYPFCSGDNKQIFSELIQSLLKLPNCVLKQQPHIPQIISSAWLSRLSPLKGLCQLESMRSEVMQITFNCQNSIVFNA